MLRDPGPLLSTLPWLVFVTAVTSPALPQEVDRAELDAFLEAERAAWDIPGMAVTIVKDDRVVLARGYGVLEAGGVEPVGARTLFAIGSTTKAFTAAALGILVDEGRLAWDDRVATLLPGFALHDPHTTREITVRDLLAQRSGLPMANLMWLSGQHDQSELVRRIRHLEPVASFRSAFSYQNVLYSVAGMVIEAVAGTSWDAFMTERLFRPLDMERTNASVDSLTGLEDVATPHAPIDGNPRPVPYRNIDHVGPAGSVNSTAADMARWLRLQLGGGALGGRRLLAGSMLAETRRPQIVMPLEGPLAAFYPEARSVAYGMGWVVSDWRGRTLLDHGGGIDGMTSLVALVPEEGLGVSILTNLQLPAPPYWILYSILDRYSGADPTDWSGRFRRLAGQMAARPEAEHVPGTRPSLPLDRYAGTYASAPLGEIVVEPRGGGLHLRYGGLGGPLEPWHFDTFRVPWTDRAWFAAAGPGWVTFRLGRDGQVEGFQLEAVPGETWDFGRVGELALEGGG